MSLHRLRLPKLDHDLQILKVFLGPIEGLDLAFETGGFIHHLLGLFPMIPEPFHSHGRFQLGLALANRFDVKDTSASETTSL